MQLQTKKYNNFLSEVKELKCKDNLLRLARRAKIFVTPTFKSGLSKSLIWAFGVRICFKDWLAGGVQIL